jgi:hypothetical protein
VRLSLVVLILVATASACGSGKSEQRGEMPTGASPSPAAASRINRCVDRLMQHATTQSAVARRYVRGTYCARFEKKGWVYEDGALSIAAQTWLENGYTCTTATGGSGELTTTVPCEPERSGGVRILECALLHVVRKSEVSAYIDHLQTHEPVKCDDGTPLDELGVP